MARPSNVLWQIINFRRSSSALLPGRQLANKSSKTRPTKSRPQSSSGLTPWKSKIFSQERLKWTGRKCAKLLVTIWAISILMEWGIGTCETMKNSRSTTSPTSGTPSRCLPTRPQERIGDSWLSWTTKRPRARRRTLKSCKGTTESWGRRVKSVGQLGAQSL